MTEQEKFLEIVALAWMIGFDDAIERLKRGEGSVGPSGFAAAKRAAEPDGPEERERSERPQSLAVSPVEAKLRCLFDILQDVLDIERDIYGKPIFWWWPPDVWKARGVRETIARLKVDVRQIAGRATESESESSEKAGDGKLPTDSIEAGNDSNNGTASGRRNVKRTCADSNT